MLKYIYKEDILINSKIESIIYCKNADLYEKYEAKLNQKLDNISGIASMAGVAIEFLKDLKKQMFKLTQDVAEIKAMLGEVKDDMKLLRGKNIF